MIGKAKTTGTIKSVSAAAYDAAREADRRPAGPSASATRDPRGGALANDARNANDAMPIIPYDRMIKLCCNPQYRAERVGVFLGPHVMCAIYRI